MHKRVCQDMIEQIEVGVGLTTLNDYFFLTCVLSFPWSLLNSHVWRL